AGHHCTLKKTLLVVDNVVQQGLHKIRLVSLAAEAKIIAVICSVAFAIKLLSLLAAYPYPIGYDIVNYYVPVTAHFEQHWPEIEGHFPFYAVLIHSVAVITGWSAFAVVPFVGTVVFVAFSIAVFAFARICLNLNPRSSAFVAVLSVIQIPVLRTTWD